LLFLGAGLLPILRWAMHRFRPQFAWPTLASWAFVGVATAFFIEVRARLERDVQVSMLSDLPLKFHPTAIRVSADVTPFGAG
jgi:hypothetical protein